MNPAAHVSKHTQTHVCVYVKQIEVYQMKGTMTLPKSLCPCVAETDSMGLIIQV